MGKRLTEVRRATTAAPTEVAGFITGQLDAAGIPFETRRNFIHVSCCFHVHSGRKKHLGFSRDTGGAHCFSCKYKGHWNAFAQHHGLTGFRQDDPALQDFAALGNQLDMVVSEQTPTVPGLVVPWQGSWRGITEATLASVPSYRWYDEASQGDRILWPVYQDGVFRGCTSASADDPLTPKTRNLQGLQADRCLFPVDHPVVTGSKAVVLVEGQFDALRLLSYGIPAVSVFGTGGWHPRKLNTLGARGVDRIVLVFDGDAAGCDLTHTIIEQGRDAFDVLFLELPPGRDPGDCDLSWVRLIKHLSVL